jgi:hypothetical protein
MARLQPSRPGFESKGQKKSVKPKPKVIKAPKEAVAPKPLARVTAGPFHDDRARPQEGWVVVVTIGSSLIEYKRFRSKEDAEIYADAVGR